MGVGNSHVKNVALWKHIHHMSNPEEALFDREALDLLDMEVPMLRRASSMGLEIQLEEESGLNEEGNGGVVEELEEDDEEDVPDSLEISFLSGRRNNLVPLVRVNLVYQRRVQVLYHVIEELISRRNIAESSDSRFNSLTSLSPRDSLSGNEADSSMETSIAILATVCNTALDGLSDEAAKSVLDNVKSSLVGTFESLRIYSLSSPSLDAMMEFLLQFYDKYKIIGSLESLTILASGRGTVSFLLQVAKRLFLDQCSMDAIANKLLEKSIKFDSEARSLMDSMRELRYSDRNVMKTPRGGRVVCKVFELELSTESAMVPSQYIGPPVTDIWKIASSCDPFPENDRAGVYYVDNVSMVASIFPSFQVSYVTCSDNHLLVVTKLGEVFARGSNEFGQCGIQQEYKAVESLTRVPIAQQVNYAAAGESHSLFVVDGWSSVYASGNNSKGQLGCCSNQEAHMVFEPRLIEFVGCSQTLVTSIAAGNTHSAVVFGRTQVFGFGCIDNQTQWSPIIMSKSQNFAVGVASYKATCFMLEKCDGDENYRLYSILQENIGATSVDRKFRLPGSISHFVVTESAIHVITRDKTLFNDVVPQSENSEAEAQLSPIRNIPDELKRSSSGVILASAELFPVQNELQERQSVGKVALELLQKLQGQNTLTLCCLRIIQRHCFVSSQGDEEEDNEAWSGLKTYLLEASCSESEHIREEAIRTIGNGFAYLSLSTADLASFMDGIKSVRYLEKFATAKLWSELLVHDKQEMAGILLERVIELANTDAPEARQLVQTMHHSILAQTNISKAFLNKYVSVLCQAYIKIFGDSVPTHATSTVQSLLSTCMSILMHENLELNACIDDLLSLLRVLESCGEGESWIDSLSWDILAILVEKCGNIRNVQDDAMSELGRFRILKSTFNSPEGHTANLSTFEQITEDPECEVMSKVSKMNLLKFKKKTGEEQVWRALRAVYAVMKIFHVEDPMMSSQKILRWIHEAKQGSEDLCYAVICRHIVDRARILLQFDKFIETQSLFSYLTVHDPFQLEVIEEELEKRKYVQIKRVQSFRLFRDLFKVQMAPDRLRYAIFSFTELISKDSCDLYKDALNALIENPVASQNPVLRCAVIDSLCECPNPSSAAVIEWLSWGLDFERCEEVKFEHESHEIKYYDSRLLTNRLYETSDLMLMPLSSAVQWSRAWKYPGLKLSKNGLCTALPENDCNFGCQSPAVISLTHALYSGKFYFQIQCTMASNTEKAPFMYSLGLVDYRYSEWDGFSNILCNTMLLDEEVGMYVNMDAGEVRFFRHEEKFYKSNKTVDLRISNQISIHRFNHNIVPLRPALTLLVPGTTALLQNVCVDSEMDIVVEEIRSPRLQSPSGGGLPSISSLSSINSSSAPSAPALEGPSEPNSNPEQHDENQDDPLRIRLAGPLNMSLPEETELLVCGQNSYGELGVKDQRPHREVLVSSHVKGLFPVQVVAGNELTAILTSQGEVYAWGYNAKGTCGYGPEEPAKPIAGTSSKVDAKFELVERPHLVRIPHFVTKISCCNGSEHMFAITSTGSLFSWGFNQYGQLGLGHKFDKISHPTRVEGALKDKHVMGVVNSYSHSLALTDDGMVYGFGLNTRGQLGIGSTGDLWTLPQKLSHLADIGRVSSMACGVEHSVVVMENGGLYSFGRNDVGQLGIDEPSRLLSALPIPVADGLSKLRSMRCEAVACGYYFTIVIANGTLHAFGKNDFGQLGIGHNHDMHYPVPVLCQDESDRFISVTCGTGHTIAATSYGKVIAWGRNKDGGLGNGTNADHSLPVEICNRGDYSLSLRDLRPLCLAAGFHHSCILVGKRRLMLTKDEQKTTQWDIKCIKSSWLMFRGLLNHTLTPGNPMFEYSVNWLLKQVGQCIPQGERSDISALMPHERSDKTIINWVVNMMRSGESDCGLYTNQVLYMCKQYLERDAAMVVNVIGSESSTLIRQLFEIAFTPGYALRSSLSFQILALLLPCVSVTEVPSKYSLKELLLYIGKSENLVISCLVVNLLRSLLPHGRWQSCINRSLFFTLANAIPQLPEDVEDLSILNTRNNAYSSMIGALQVLGGATEVLYSSSKVSVIASEVEGQEGVLDWYQIDGGQCEIGQVSFTSSPPIFVRKQQELFPMINVEVPVDSIQRPERLLSLLVNLVQQNVRLSSQQMNNVIVARMHETAKARASQVVFTLLHDQPTIVQSFVSNGHLQAVTSLLAAPRGRLDGLSVQELKSRFLQLELLRRRLDSESSAASISIPDVVGDVWTCSECNYENNDMRTCVMCFSRRGTGEVAEEKEETGSNPADGLRKLRPRMISLPDETLNLNQTDEIACMWNFRGGIKSDNKRIKAAVRKLEVDPDELQEEANESNGTPDSAYLVVSSDSYLSLQHFFDGNGSTGSVYLNQYSVVLDLCIPASTMTNEYTSILQTTLNNTALADWYVRSDGSVGCINYSKPGLVKPDAWHRLVMTVDTSKGEILFYVDGTLATTVKRDGKTIIEEDDRWALDSYVCMFRDMDQSDCGQVAVSRIQLRTYTMTPKEIEVLGNSESDIPLPSIRELAELLSQELKLPQAWCIRALQSTRHRLPNARDWLKSNEQALIVRTVAEARMLTALGYSRLQCAQAICSTSSLGDAIRTLLDGGDSFDYRDLNISRIMRECAKDDCDAIMSDIMTLSLDDDDRDSYNKTYEMYDAIAANIESNEAGAAASNSRSSARSLPPLGSGMRQINAELWETARQLFVAFARQATVSILENSLMVRSTGEENNDLIEDMQEKLLAVDGSGHNFLRNYLRAFPDSIRKDIHVGPVQHEINRSDPIQVLRRKLLMVFPQEIANCEEKNNESLTDGLTTWVQYYHHNKPNLSKQDVTVGKTVWWFLGDKMHQGSILAINSHGDNVDEVSGTLSHFQQLARAIYDYIPQRQGDLEIQAGDTVIVFSATKGGWGKAKDLATGRIGTIPLNYVEAIGEEFDGVANNSRNNNQKDLINSNSYQPLDVTVQETGTSTEHLLKGALLIFDQPPTSMDDPRMRQAILEKADDEMWKRSVLRTLSEDVLQELVLLARGPWQFLPGGLQAGPSVQFQELWCDRQTTATEIFDRFTKKSKQVVIERPATIRIWRPFADSGFCILGDVVTTSGSTDFEKPPAITVVSDDDGMGGKTTTSKGLPLLVPPIRYKLIWQNGENHSDEPVSFWQPIPPEGYVALGCVAVKGHSKREPDPKREQLTQLRCVHESCVQLSTLHRGLWTHHPEDSSRDPNNAGETPGVTRTDSGIEDGVRRRKGSFSKPPLQSQGVTVWEIDNSSRTFVPVLATNETIDNEKSKLLSVNRVDASSIESRLCVESERKTSDEDSKTRMLHGLRFASYISSTEPEDVKESDDSQTMRPYHLGLASTTDSNHGSSELLLWILQLLCEFDSNEAGGMGAWAKRVFSPQLVHALLRFSKAASTTVQIKAIRMLAMVIRRTPYETLQGKLRGELLELRVQMENVYKRQAHKSKDGQMDEMPLFSSLLCALAEVFVSVSLTEQQSGMLEPEAEPVAIMQPLHDLNEIADDTDKHEYVSAVFDGQLGIEILSSRDVLIVHSVKENGVAWSMGVQPYDIFWMLNGRKLADYEQEELWDTIKHQRPLEVTFLRDKNVATTFRQNDSAIPETPAEDIAVVTSSSLGSKENWFAQLSELAAIMEALVHREHGQLPAEFLMSEDTFLKLVLANHTAVVESWHPYSTKMVQGEISIPGAEALVVRFDRRCSTQFGKTLQLWCDVMFQKIQRNIHVETLQGCFGGCSVHVPASVLRYNFPVPQTMNWGLHRSSEFKAPEIRVSNNGRTATLRKDKVWQTVFSTTGFNSGINTWEVRVDRTGSSANIFFGVAMRSAKVSNYLGCDDKGWGWIGCMACWHGGRKVRFKFGKRLKAGDIVRVTLDIPRRAMSIACNGEDWGVAFNKLPLPSTVLKPGNELIPTFSFYNKDDQITLLSGSSAIDTETAGILHQLRSSFEQQHATARITQQFNNGEEQNNQNSGENARLARRRRSSVTVPRGLGSRTARRRRDEESQDNSNGGESSEASNVVSEHALMLSALGYPIEWCNQALHAMDNDVNRAAEYLITHSDRMAEETKLEEHRAAVEEEDQVIAEEAEWLSEVNSQLEFDERGDSTPSTPLSPRQASEATSAALQLASSRKIIQKERVVRTASDHEEDIGTIDRRGKREKSISTSNEWGYRMTVSPLFSRETTKRIAKEPRNRKRLQMFHSLFKLFTLAHDCALVRLVNETCARAGEDPLTLSPNDLEPTADELANYKILADIQPLHLQLRFLVLRNFNRRLAHVLPLIDLSCATYESAIAASLRSVRGLVMSSVKKALFERVLNDSHTGDDHWMQQNKVPTVTLDRNKAADFLKSGRVDVRGTRTVFGQLFSQLHGNGHDDKSEQKNPLLIQTQAVHDASLLRNSHRAWYTILAGERADDYGGPYRDVFNQACQELLTPALPLFLPCPNQVSNQGANRGKYLPCATAVSHTTLAMFEFVGKLMGISMRTKNPFVLDLPSFVWKQLCNDQVTLHDIKMCDLEFFDTLEYYRSLSDDELKALDLKFTMKGSDGKIVEIIPGGNSTPVTIGRREDYLRALERSRLHELDRQCAAIARGLGTQVPRNLLSIFTADELELMVCGPPEVDIAILKANTIYGDGINEKTPAVQLFWTVLEDFSQEDKQKYLRFVWGRSRLPSSTADWERKHKINKYSKVPADNYMPIGHTCFFTIDLPLYTSIETCKAKLLYAVTHCIAIDADETTVARQAAEGGEWLNNQNEEEEDDD